MHGLKFAKEHEGDDVLFQLEAEKLSSQKLAASNLNDDDSMAFPTMDRLMGKDPKLGTAVGGSKESEGEDDPSGKYHALMDISVSRILCSENACLGSLRAPEGASLTC
ncbi:hypothetical protein Ancab_030855 [Ancistrocladus abbreviatus]